MLTLDFTPKGIAWRAVGSARTLQFTNHAAAFGAATIRAREETATGDALRALGAMLSPGHERRTILAWLANPAVRIDTLQKACPWMASLSPRILGQLYADGLYDGYLERQGRDIANFEREEAVSLENVDFTTVGGLSTEMRERLNMSLPASLGAASRMPGITPAALTAILGHVRKQQMTRGFT